MKVFITHAFGGGDEPLASALKNDLEAAGIGGYLAEKTQRYDLLISDKIRQEIDESDWLVAIITKRSHASASVHEEIGYALGRGVRVALMLEEGVEKSGVLVYGREYEVFAVPKFSEHSRRMARFIAGSPRPAPRPPPSIGEAARGFLESRNVMSSESATFAKNEYFPYLYSPLPDGKKPIALFTLCPYGLGSNADVAAQEFKEWVGSTSSVTVDGQQARVLGLEAGVDIGKLVAIDRRPYDPSRRSVLAYREFLSTGFFEFGTSHLFFGRKRGKTEMHLCYMVGEFWSFLTQARLFHQRAGLGLPSVAYLSVRNSGSLYLGNYGDGSSQPGPAPGPSIPPTHRTNISLRYDLRSVREATDEEIAQAAKEMAKKVCNAYGETTPRCYDKDGLFSWGMWHAVARNAARGDRT